MNNELKLFKYLIKNNGKIITNYDTLGYDLNIPKSTIRNWTRKLLADGLIEIQSKIIHNNKRIIYTVTEKGHEKYENEKDFVK